MAFVPDLRSTVISFVMALFLAACLQGPIQICKKHHIPRAATAVSILVLVIAPIAAILVYVVYRVLSAAVDVLEQLIPLIRGAANWEEWFYRFITALPPDAQTLIHSAVDALFAQSDTILTKFAAKLGTLSANWIAGLPHQITDIGLFILFFLFCAIGYTQIRQLLISILPNDWSRWLGKLHQIAKKQLINWCRAEGKLVLLIFGELSFGLCMLRTQAWIWIALCIALVDMIPFIGAGLILLPWAAGHFLSGNRMLAISLLLLWGIVWITRTMLEPRLVGNQLQLPSAISFLSAVIGIKIWGLKGLILFPVLTAVFITVFSQEKKGTARVSGALEKNDTH